MWHAKNIWDHNWRFQATCYFKCVNKCCEYNGLLLYQPWMHTLLVQVSWFYMCNRGSQSSQIPKKKWRCEISLCKFYIVIFSECGSFIKFGWRTMTPMLMLNGLRIVPSLVAYIALCCLRNRKQLWILSQCIFSDPYNKEHCITLHYTMHVDWLCDKAFILSKIIVKNSVVYVGQATASCGLPYTQILGPVVSQEAAWAARLLFRLFLWNGVPFVFKN